MENSIGIIGGADGPTMVFAAGQPNARLHAACSSLHFEPTDEVQWRMVFREKYRPLDFQTVPVTEKMGFRFHH